MRRTPVALVPLALSLLLAACTGDRDTTAPPRAMTPAPTASSLTLPATCDYPQIKSYGRGFLTKNNDIFFSYLSDAQKDPDPTLNLWRAINRIAEANKTADQALQWAATAIYGEQAVTGIFACIPGGVGDVSSIANGSLASAIVAGIFEVRGGGFATGPAFGYLAVNGAKAHSIPRYGVEHNPVNTQWGPNPFLVVGVPTQYGPTYVPYGTNINTNGVPKNGFDLFTIPVDQSKAGDVIGVCVQALATPGSANMLVHAGQIQEHIAPRQICDSQFGALSSPSLFASLARRAVSYFTPALAFGDELDAGDYSGGGPTSWSPNVIGSVVADSIQLAFTAQSTTNANIGENIHFEVTATISGQPVPDVNVTISIFGNNGTPGTIVGITTVPTNGSGVAAFDVSFTKAGGYYIQATGDFGGFPTQSALSQQFWIKNQ